jgi:uncharacterized protein (TIGR03435 family)
MNLPNLVTMAYDIPHYRLTAADWMNDAKFDLVAKIPPGTTKEQLRLMEQNLLAERFKLTVHHETKEMQMYELTVGKGGPKLKESVEEPEPPAPKADASGPAPPPPGPPKFTMGADGFPAMTGNGMIMMNGRARRQQTKETMDHFVQFVSGQLGRPVTDATGLKGKYDFVLTWASEGMAMPGRAGTAASSDAGAGASAPEAEPLPTLMQAVQQLGLKLESKKGPVDILVIDHAEKVPIEN